MNTATATPADHPAYAQETRDHSAGPVTLPCPRCAELEAMLAKAREALGAHIQADAYRDAFPDNEADAEASA